MKPRAVLMSIGLVLTAACSRDPRVAADPESVIVPESATSVVLDATTTTSEPGSVASSLPRPAATASSDVNATAAPTGAAEPAANAPAQPEPTPTTRVTPTEAEIIGDGPVLSGAPPDDPDQTGLVPVFFVFDAAITQPCGGDFGTVTLRWEVIGTESVYVAVNDVDVPFLTDQPPAGLAEVPLDCERGNTYFVVAENPDGRSFQSVAIAPSGLSSPGQ